jgi:hypothetical protein
MSHNKGIPSAAVVAFNLGIYDGNGRKQRVPRCRGAERIRAFPDAGFSDAQGCRGRTKI